VVAQGRQGPWQPRGSGLLVAVVAVSVVALVVHGIVALTLLNGAAHRTVAAGKTVVAPPPRTPVPTERPTGPPPTSAPSTPPTSAPVSSPGGPLHIDHACLLPDNPPSSAHIPSGDPFGSDLSHLGADAELQRLYVVQSGELKPADAAGPVRDCDRQLWAIVVAATPAEVLRYVDELLVFDADLNTGYVGEVQAQTGSSEASAHWRLSLAPNGASDLEVALTVAHEVGHLLSLNRAEMTGEDQSACQGLMLEEGCLKDGSSFVTYLDDMWGDDLFDTWSTANDITDEQQRADALDDFYQQHHEKFVDSYAASHPVEDFAQSFALWCALGPTSPVLPQVIEGDPHDGADKLAWFEDPHRAVSQQARARCEALRALTR